jgi:hypothetical protein
LGNSERHRKTGGAHYGVSARSVAVVCGLYETEPTMKRKAVELVHEGKFAAEVPVELIEEEGGWSPYFSFEDAQKLETVRLALRAGDIAAAAKHGRVFELMPIAGK